MTDTPPPGTGPRRGPPIFNAPPATLGLCASLVIAYLVGDLFGFSDRAGSILVFDVAAFRGQFSSGGTGLSAPAVIALLGHAFAHADLGHLATNTLFLLAFATPVERTFGAVYLITLFAVSTVAGALAMAWWAGDVQHFLVGASGGVYGVSAGAALILRARGDETARRTGTALLIFLVVVNLLLALTEGASGLFGFRIAWEAHLGGLAAGLALVAWALTRGRH